MPWTSWRIVFEITIHVLYITIYFNGRSYIPKTRQITQADFGRLYLQAQVELFDNFEWFWKLRPCSLRYVDLASVFVYSDTHPRTISYTVNSQNDNIHNLQNVDHFHDFPSWYATYRVITFLWETILSGFFIFRKDLGKGFSTHVVRASNSTWARR